MTSGERALKGIVEDLNDSLSRCGLMYHIFYRAKSATSIEKKMKTDPAFAEKVKEIKTNINSKR